MRFLALLLLLCTLTSCAMAPSSYLSVQPHAGSGGQAEPADAVAVQDYDGLKRAILGFVETGRTEGAIRAANYSGNVEEDLIQAAYEVSKQDPLGAYAVDYMTHDCTLIVNYYEIRVRITFRRSLREIQAIETIPTQTQLRSRLEEAVDRLEDRVVLRLPSYRDPDIPAMVADYCAANPETVMETPRVTVSVYPDSGSVRIVEVDLAYTQTPQSLRSMQKAVQESLDAAAEYIRYRRSDRDKVGLLLTYLTERFSYEAEETATPLYAALCGGVADPRGLTQAWQLICDLAGVECYTVEGLRSGQPYTWNIVSLDGVYRHLDLARSVLDESQSALRTDREMEEYYWNMEEYPACEPLPDAPEEPQEEPPAEEEPAPPEEEEAEQGNA